MSKRYLAFAAIPVALALTALTAGSGVLAAQVDAPAVAFHTEVIAAIQSTLLPAIKNEELRSLVVKVAPAFQAHLAMAQNLGKRLATR